MLCKITILLLGLQLGVTAFAAEPDSDKPTAQEPLGVQDPRGVLSPTILFYNKMDSSIGFSHALLIYARHDKQPPNQILGVEGSFSDEQVIAALKNFYLEWQSPSPHPDGPRPKLILAAQNWGCGSRLHEPLKTLSAELGFDVYMLYPVLTDIQQHRGHPTTSDKRLGEILTLIAKTPK
jgi:hypothetical protein